MTDAQHWSPEVVEAVARHMNVDHGEDNLRIVQALGGVPEAVEARMTGMGPEGLHYAVLDGDLSKVDVVVPWLRVPQDRAGVRSEVVALHDAALARG